MVDANASEPTKRDAQALRLVTALTALIASGQMVVAPVELARRAQVTAHLAKAAVDDWVRQGWLRPTRVEHERGYLVTPSCPTAPNASAIEALAILQTISAERARLGLLTYGYASALGYHGLSAVVHGDIHVFHSDPSVTPPQIAAQTVFTRSTKRPTQWGTWDGRCVFVSRRHPDLLRPYQRALIDWQGVRVPCTTATRTLIDCWLRPDLADGLDRVADAWATYLERESRRLPAVRREIATILRDSAWLTMRDAFIPWLAQQHDAFAVAHPDWRGLVHA